MVHSHRYLHFHCNASLVWINWSTVLCFEWYAQKATSITTRFHHLLLPSLPYATQCSSSTPGYQMSAAEQETSLPYNTLSWDPCINGENLECECKWCRVCVPPPEMHCLNVITWFTHACTAQGKAPTAPPRPATTTTQANIIKGKLMPETG